MGKLDYLSSKHAVARSKAGGKDYEEMLDMVVNHVRTLCSNNADNLVPTMSKDEKAQRSYIDAALRIDVKNYKSAADYVASHAYFFLQWPKGPISIKRHRGAYPDLHESWDAQEGVLKERLVQCLTPLTLESAEWTHDTITEAIKDVQASFVAEPLDKLPSPNFVSAWTWQYIRSYICFGEAGPSMVDTMQLLGSDIVLNRIKNVKITRIPYAPLQVKESRVDEMVVEGSKKKSVEFGQGETAEKKAFTGFITR